jgi:ELWxxDGT repeat protein
MLSATQGDNRFFGAIAAPGQVDTHTLTTNATTQLWFDSQTNDGNLSWSVTGPQGTLTTRNSSGVQPFSYGDAQLTVPGTNQPSAGALLPAGTYTVTVSGSGDSTGAYSFRVLDLATATAITASSLVSGTLPTPNGTSIYKLAAAAGDNFSFSNVTYTGDSASWRLVDPYGKEVFNTSVSTNSRVDLAATGDYTLIIEGSVGATQPVSFSFVATRNSQTPPPAVTGTVITPGTAVSGTLDATGTSNYTFTLAAPTRLWFDSRTLSYSTNWKLTGPQGTVQSGRPFAYEDQNLGLLPAGTYSLQVTGNNGDPFAFNLLDMAAATSLTLGESTTVTLDPARSTKLYTFNGTAGQIVYLDHTATSNTDSSYTYGAWSLYDQYGNTIGSYQWGLGQDSGRVTLPSVGAYTLVIQGDGYWVTGTTTTTFTVWNVTDTTAPLTLGTPVSGTISGVGQIAIYHFTLAAPTRLWFDSQSNAGTWTLTGPQGTMSVQGFYSPTVDSPFSYGDRNLGLLPAGSYSLRVTGSEGDSFAFNLLDMSAATGLTLGESTTAVLDPANSTKLYTFTGTAGQIISLDNTSYSRTNQWRYSDSWRLYDPNGSQLGGGTNAMESDYPRLTLPSTGAYTLVLEGNNSGTTTATFTVSTVTDTTMPLTLGTPMSGTISGAGQIASHTFTLAAPTRLWFDSRTNSSSTSWSLTGPQGTVQSSRPFNYDDHNLGLLPAGTYSLQVTGNEGDPFAFNLLDMAAATSLTLGESTTATLDQVNSTAAYSFNGTAGQIVYLDSTAVSNTDSYSYGSWRLYDQYGSQIGSTLWLNQNSGRITLPSAGTYTLVLQGAVNATGTTTGSFTVWNVTDTTTQLTLGTPVSGTISAVGQIASHTFTLAAPTRLWFDSRTNSSSTSWWLTGPQGTVQSSRPFYFDDLNLGLLPAGTYSLNVSGNNGDPFAFNLLDLSAATSLTLDESITATLDPANSTAAYAFNGTAGQIVYLDNTDSSYANGTWSLYDQYGKQIGSNKSLNQDSGRITLPSMGTYTLVLQGGVSATGTTTGTFTVWNVTDTTAPLTLGTPVSGMISGVGQIASHTFTLAAPTQLWFDSQTNNGNLSWSVTGPQGTLTARSFYGVQPFSYGDAQLNVPGTNQPSARALLPAGTYTVTVSGFPDSTGAYSFRVLDLATATAITAGSLVSGTLPTPNGTSIYKLAAAAGDNFSFSNVTYTGDSASWRLVDPYGNEVFNTSVSTNSRVDLAATGDYTLIIEGSVSATQPASFSFVATRNSQTPPPAVTGTAITPGTAVSGTLDATGTSNYTFTLAAPTRLWFDSRTNSGSTSWSLTGPQGTVQSSQQFYYNDLNLGLLPAGTYSLQVSGNNGDPFAFNLLDMSVATGLTLGESTTATLDPANSTAAYAFNGTAGQIVYFDNTAFSNTNAYWYGSWSLYDQYGNQIGSGWYLNQNSGRITLPSTGTYTLVLQGAVGATGTTTGAFTVWNVTDTTAPLTLGTPVSGTISGAGQIASHTFTLAAPTRLWFDSRTNAGSTSWSLTGPQGTVQSSRPFNYDDQNLGLLPAGTYSLNVTGNNGDPFAFNLIDLSAATDLTLGESTTATLDPVNSTAAYAFNGTAGQVVSIDNTAFSNTHSYSYASWRLYDQDGNQIGSTWYLNQNSGRITLPSTGTYTLVLQGVVYATGTTTGTFTVWNVTDTTAPLTLGTPVSGTISGAGQIASHTFTLAAPTRLWFDSRTNSSSTSWSLTGPQGTVQSSRQFNYDDLNLGLLPAGTYHLQVTGNNGDPFVFNLLDMSVATGLTLGEPTTATLDPVNSTAVYAFNGTAGQIVYFDNTAFSNTHSYAYGSWTLYDQYGNQIGSTWYLNQASGRITLPSTGTYTLVLKGFFDATGTTTGTFTAWSVTDTTAPLTLGTPVSGTIAGVGQVASHTFTLAAPTRLWFDSRTNSSSTSWWLTGPQGTVQSSRPFAYDDQNLGLLPAGTYHLQVSGNNGDSFAFNLIELSAATGLTLGESITATLDPANSTLLYKFTGTAGQVVFLDNTAFSSTDASGYGGYAIWKVFDQYGTQVGNPWSLNGDSGRLTLPSTGNYTLVLEGYLRTDGTTMTTFTVRTVNDNVRQLWGSSGNDVISLQSLSGSSNGASLDVLLNGYLMGTLTNSTPLTVLGRGGDDTFSFSGGSSHLTLLGGAGRDRFVFADGANVASIDGGADGGTLDYSAYSTGVVLDAANSTFTGANTVANITAVVGSKQSDAPIGSANTVSTLESTAYTFAASDFSFTDPGDTPANTLLAVKIASMPTTGSLTNNGLAVTAGSFVQASDIVAGKLVYMPASTAPAGKFTTIAPGKIVFVPASTAPASATFTFQVQDNGGTAGGGLDLDPMPRTMTVAISASGNTPVNNAPTDITLSATTIAENLASGTAVGTLTTTDPDSSNTFTYTLVSGTGSTDNDFFTIVGGELRTAASFNFEAKSSYSIRVRSTDQGSLFTEKVFTIAVTDVNEPPTGISLANAVASLPSTTSTASRVKVADIVVADDSLGTNAISLSGSDAASFEVVGAALYVKAGTVLGAGGKTSYAVTLSAVDSGVGGSMPVTTSYTLAVTSVIGHRPVFSGQMQTVGVTRVSTDGAGGQGNGFSYTPVFSPDGSRIAFYSSASNLVAGDSNDADDVFVKDLVSGAITRVSTNSSGGQGDSGSGTPFFSPDGSRIAFYSSASNLVAGDTNNTLDVFVKDLVTGAITRVSTNSSGDQGDSASWNPVFSPDGSRILFASVASNLVADDTKTISDVFVKDLVTNAITRVSTDSSDGQSDSSSWIAVFSPNGSRIAFISDASNLVAGDTNNISDVFVKDLVTGAITRVSTDSSGGQGDSSSTNPVFSPDGSRIAFSSVASNLVSGDTNSVDDVFVKDLAIGTITRVSTDASGGQGNSHSFSPVFSPDGSRIAFSSVASNLVAGDTNDTVDVFVKDLATGTITRVSTDGAGGQGNGGSSAPVFSPDGSRIAFESNASNLVAGDTNSTMDGFVAQLGFVFSVVDGTTAVTTLAATDSDAGQTLAWSIAGTDAALFTIDAASGALRFVDAPSFLSPADQGDNNVYDIQVSVTDGVFTTTVPAQITVTQQPNAAPTELTLSESAVAAGQPVGTLVGTLSTVDPDAGDTFTYTLVSGTGSTDNASFTIVGGELRTAASFDFEAGSSYSIRVRSTDQGSLSTEKVFTITVNEPQLSPRDITVVGDVSYFVATTAAEGTELWKTDGTPAGTVLVKDINAGVGNSYPRNITAVGSTVFFTADDGVHGRELWKTDGTAAGTVLVKDIKAGTEMSYDWETDTEVELPANSYTSNLIAFDSQLFFVADDGVHGSELWKSDGTAAGTVLVKDIRAGESSSYPNQLVVFAGKLFFGLSPNDDGSYDDTLWSSDGTEDGTVVVADGSVAMRFVVFDDKLFFSGDDGVSGTELWVTDGTAEGTALVKDIAAGTSSSSFYSGPNGSYPSNFTLVGNTLFFTANDRVNGSELWKTDGTANGTVLVKNIAAGTWQQSSWDENGEPIEITLPRDSYPYSLTALGNTLVFVADDGVNGRELWKSDGTENGTVLVKDLLTGRNSSDVPRSSSPNDLTPYDGAVFFIANRDELWKTDGTEAGTTKVKDIDPNKGGDEGSGSYASMAVFNGKLLFAADDGVNGSELWVSDGSTAGTVRLKDLPSAPASVLLSATTVAENQPVGSTVGTLSTTDPDTGKTFTYTLVSGAGSTDNASFTIVGNVLKTAASLDFETKSSYSIRVRLADQDGLSTEKTFTVTVTNVNESPTEITLSESAVVAGQPVGTLVGTLSTVDPDAGDTFTYMLVEGEGSADNALFVIDGDQIMTAASMAAADYRARIRSTDAAGLSTEEIFVITITSPSSITIDNGRDSSRVGYFSNAVGTGGALTNNSVTVQGRSGNAFINQNFIFAYTLYVDVGADGGGRSLQSTTVTMAPTLVAAGIAASEGTFTGENGLIRWRVESSFDATGVRFESRVTFHSDQPLGALRVISYLDEDVFGVSDDVLNPVGDPHSTGFLVFTRDGTERVGFAQGGTYQSGPGLVNATYDGWTADKFSDLADVIEGVGAQFSVDGIINAASLPALLGSDLGTAYGPNDITSAFAWRVDAAATSSVVTTALALLPSDTGMPVGVVGVAGIRQVELSWTPPASSGDLPITNYVVQYRATTSTDWITLLRTPSAASSATVTGLDDGVAYECRVAAVNAVGTGMFSTTSAPVTPLPPANSAPTDILLSPSTIAENLASGTAVGTLSTTDPDASNTFTYTLVTGTGSTDNASFTIVGGELRTAASFNFEAKSSYSIRVRSTDQGGLSTDKVFTIAVTNVNETPTDITLSASSIAENLASGTTVGTLSTTDPDASNTFTYTLVTGTGSTDNASFTIVGGELRTAASFNFEAKSSYSIRVRATDQGSLSTEKVFTISVTNVNETPTDIALSASSIAENLASGTAVGTLSTTDPDASNTFTYTLVTGTGSTDNASFTIVGGELRTAASFNFEAKSSYSIRVRATDQGSLSTEKVFTISVTNVNETPTDITLSASSIAENLASGTAVGTLSTTDPDASNTFTYTLVSGTGSTDNASFTIVGGQLRTAASFNFEAKSSYSIRVRSTDQGSLSTEKVFTISVTNVNETPTDIALSASSIAENLASGTTVGTLSTTDPDAANTFTYTLVTGTGSTDNASFTIVGGELRTAASFNFEAKSSYSIRVRSTDQGSLSTEKVFTIAVTNVNETPTDIALSATTIAENLASGTTVGTLSTTDPDASNTFTYTLVSGTGSTDNASFTIVGGQLRTAASFNFEAKSSYSIRVRSTDQGSLSTEKVFTIAVTNVNETPTDITLSATSIAENLASGTAVGTLSTTDPDASNTFTYTLVTGTGSTDNASFTIVGGQLRTAASFNFEAKSSYSIRVRSTDQGSLSTEKVFTISVTNVNETPTDIALSATSIAENLASGTTVGTLSTTDPDASNTFTYTLVTGTGSTDNASFTIVGGELRTAASFDFETKNSYSIRVRATDRGGLSTEKVFTIAVTNVFEPLPSRPVFSGPLTKVGVTRVSTDTSGGQGNSGSWGPVFSPDGAKVVFYSEASNLVSGDTNSAYDNFVKNLGTGAITRVSTDAAGAQGNGTFLLSVFSPDGSKVALYSNASNLVSGDTNNAYDIFVKDLVTGTITRVSTDASGSQGNSGSFKPVFSPDGSKVAFDSNASNLVSGDTNSAADIFVKDLVTGTITRVSTDASGSQGNSGSFKPVFSPDGSKVAFDSNASNLVSGDTNGRGDVFVKDLVTGTITRVSTDASGGQGNSGSLFPVFSPDGSKVAFSSNASNLVSGDWNSQSDVFVKDLVTGTIARVSTDASGGQGNSGSYSPVFSPDGSKVAFYSEASNLVSGDTNSQSDVFVKDLVTGTITRVSTDASGGQGNSSSLIPVFSPDGSKVAFSSNASNLVSGDTNSQSDVFVASLGFVLSVVEGTTAVATLGATDRDPGTTLSYSISGTDAARFTINPATAALTFVSPPRFATPGDAGADNVYDIQVKVTDGLFTTTVPARITVTKAPNSAPTDIALSATSIAENLASGTAVGTLSTTDPDASNTFTYTLVSGTGSTDNASFTIVGGQLRTAASFNFEAKSSYSIRVRSTDQGSLSTEKVFTISVTNVNETPTDITLSATSIAENLASGTTVGTLSTTDPDASNTFTYTLVSGTGSTDNASFTIVGGQLRAAASFNFEAKSSYSIRVRATDQGSLSTEKVFTIAVTNVNETPTNITLSTATIAENQASGTTVGTLSTTDPDASNTFTYTLVSGTGSTDNASFTIVGGQLRAAATFNFEAKSSYSVRVRSTDQGSLSTEKVFAISVTNRNEAPTDIALSTATIAENLPSGTAVGTLSTTDPDGGNTFTYTLVSGTGSTDNASFTIVSGQLRTAASFNFEAKSSYSIRVRSTDQGSLSTEKVFTISVTDVAELPDSPTALVTARGDGQVYIGWTAPASNRSSPITNYLVQYSSNAGVSWTPFVRSASAATAATVTGLVNGTAYVFRVAAVNQIGTSGFSPLSTAVTPAFVPSVVKDIAAGVGSSSPRNSIAIGNTLYFTANDGIQGEELWKSAGSAAGTVLVKDIRPGAGSGSPSQLIAIGNTIFFMADDGVNGRELWKSDGTAAGTVLVKDIYPGSNGSSPNRLTAIGSTLYFSASTGANGEELWKSDGTAAGTVLVKDINTGSSGSSPNDLTAVGNTLYFSASNGVNGVELWKSDGTAAGTVLVKDVNSGSNSSTPAGLIAVGSTLYFSAFNSSTGRELWKSDGTAAGTVLVKDITPGLDDSWASGRIAVGGTLYFVANDGVNGYELWKSNGTAAGTVLVKDINTGANGSIPNSLVAIGSTIYFSAFNGLSGAELWKSDGTAAGTVIVKDINTGSSGDPRSLIAVGNTLYFTADNGVNGRELWKSDGTAAGTTLLFDIVVGASNGTSLSTKIVQAGSQLFFTGPNPVLGEELLVLPLVPPAPANLAGTRGSGRVTLTWTAPAAAGAAAITDYLIQFSVNGGSTWSTFARPASNATTAAVTGLTNGRSYLFRVAAVNKAGTGPFSLISAAIVPRA